MEIINQKRLVKIFEDNKKNNSDTRFCFLLGAGASVTSGINAGKKLATEWFNELKDILDEKVFDTWIKDEKIKDQKLEESYTQIFKKRFKDDKKGGYETLQRIMEGKDPGIGYSIFANIINKTEHNFVITTNFDTLIEDALFWFTNKRPLVCGHEFLANFIHTHSKRPTIIKVHRDILLDPFNEPENTEKLAESWENSLSSILSESPLIVLGYAGNDGSLMGYLENIKNRKPIYWCARDTKNLNGKIKTVLSRPEDRIVEIEGFDELMLSLMNNVFKFENLFPKEIEKSPIVKAAKEKSEQLKKQLEKYADKEFKIETKSEEFKKDVLSVLPDWYSYQLKANELETDDDKNRIYLEGLNQFPDSPELHGNYALFLNNTLKDYDVAEKHYKKALEIEPDDVDYNGNYAFFLQDVQQDFDAAEMHYKKALEIEPNYANNNGNYAGLLLASAQKDDALKHLNLAFKTDRNDLLCELWFYVMAHYPERYDEAKNELDKLLLECAESPYWDFTKNIKRAETDNHPNIDVLKDYAKQISGLDY